MTLDESLAILQLAAREQNRALVVVIGALVDIRGELQAIRRDVEAIKAFSR